MVPWRYYPNNTAIFLLFYWIKLNMKRAGKYDTTLLYYFDEAVPSQSLYIKIGIKILVKGCILKIYIMERAIVLRDYLAIFIVKSNVSISLGHYQTVKQRRQNIKN